jgi:transmembrane sensor
MAQNRFWNLLAKKLSGEAIPEEIAELEQLLKENPEYIFPAEHIRNIWQQNDNDKSYDAELAFELHLEKMKGTGIPLQELQSTQKTGDWAPIEKKPGLKRLYALGLLALVLFASLLAVWKFKSPGKAETLVANTSEVSAPLGSKTSLVLPDSSLVWLNAGSRIKYAENFGLQHRNIVLTGEAFFEVRKSSIPFVISAKGVRIRVMGTAFNVKSYPHETTTETSLIRGAVEITLDKRPGEKFILRPHEKLVVSNDPETEVETALQKKEPIVAIKELTQTSDSTIIETSWVDNKLVFQDESFADLAVRMERWYGVKIEFRDPQIPRERLYGTFTRETIQEALELLQITTPFQFSIKSNSIIISKQ